MIALGLSLVFLFLSNSKLIQAIERKAYDLGVQASYHEAGDQIAIIAIDDESIKNIGRWPWSRNVHAKIIDMLSSSKVVGNTVFFLEPQVDPGLEYINQIDAYLKRNPTNKVGQESALNHLVQEAQIKLNADAQLAQSMQRANNVVLAMPFKFGTPQGNPDNSLPSYVTKYSLHHIVDEVHAVRERLTPIQALAATPPIEPIAIHARAIGHLNYNPDIDGAIRTEPLVIQYFDQYYPSVAMQIASVYLNLNPQDVQIKLGQGIKLGKLNIATDSALQMRSFFYSNQEGRSQFPMDSFYDVYSGKISSEKYKNKIVLIGMAATGSGDMQITPISASMPPIEALAHTVASILNEDFFITPDWAMLAELVSWLIIAIYLVYFLPKLSAGMATWISLIFIMLILATHFILMTHYGLWIQLMMPLSLLIFGHVLLSTKRYLLTERVKDRSEAESSESNKNLALMLQSQGQLDMAFDRFRKCTMDDSLMDALYNLGLDFERKRQFNKAEAVFAYMAQYQADYKDLKQRITSSKRMSDTLILGGHRPSKTLSTLLATDESVEKPMLGRYQIEKELGKGAMGTVYLGVDPKIGRQVAIKTLDLNQTFETTELDLVRSRFFREAETAGKLSHPNIVIIYDAGEEHDLAYIAMELLKGHDLNENTKRGHLLPLPKLLGIMIKVAEALDYAHQHHVIHRDVKPANIMYEPETELVKVTDFGIARITDASKTKTGMVLGTPNFMSPEQLSGKKLDGRSDLFALGTTMYQLVTGQLPFEGDSMANLMYNISNQTQKGILELNPDLPPDLSIIINKLLEKDPNKRYSNGKSVAQEIGHCLIKLLS
ncbi:MAG TPA: serine/threonine protein kinase [Methylophilaceae bacterium]|nr:serine/threonine protein kinase [Methylophilaceae bacterium]